MRIKDKMKLLITAAILALSFITLASEQTQYNLRVDGITCPFCVASSEKALKNLNGINAITTNIETGTMHICAEPDVVLTDDQLKKLFLKNGFTYRHFAQSQGCSLNDNQPSNDHAQKAEEHEPN